MCGIVGYVGPREAAPVLIEGLRHLEYRGYDSAGIAVANGGPAEIVRATGKLANLERRLGEHAVHGHLGIGHTRWATHGPPSDVNAHPHKAGRVSVVHNGIIENHAELRAELVRAGRVPASQTDTELVAHLVDEALLAGAPSLVAAVRAALARVRGTYALVVLSDDDKERLVAAKNASPLVIGIGRGETFIASDVPAILEHTRDIVYLEEGDLAEVGADGIRISAIDDETRAVTREVETITWSAAEAAKNGYAHFMLKEIHEQPRAVRDTLAHGLDGFEVDPCGLRRIVAVACGSSYHASLAAKYMIESATGVPFEVDLASEFRYRGPALGARDLVIATSQSGETADTLAAVKEAKRRGAQVLAITNTVGSAIARLADHALYTHAGPEIGVASTKAFTSQLAAFALLALHLATRAPGGEGIARDLERELRIVPELMERALANAELARSVAGASSGVHDMLFLGRGPNFPIALEGALKLKEISYVHAEGYAAGEMKHGPIALVEEGLPVVVIATRGPDREKVMSNLAEVRARQAHVIAVASDDDDEIAREADVVFRVPTTHPVLEPLLTVVPLQLLAYYFAVARGSDVDQPRNLAKSVTVE